MTTTTTAPNPVIKPLRLDHLTVDATVQRNLDERWVARKLAAEGFRADAMGVLVVSHRSDGTYHVIDGQHRRAIATQAGHGESAFDCQVFDGLSLSEEAAMFRLLNERRAVQVLDKFIVRVTEGDTVAVALHSLLRRHGWSLGHNKSDGTFGAVIALETIYGGAKIRSTGEQYQVVDLMLAIISTAWGHKSDAVRGEIITGLGMLLLRHERELDIAKLISALAGHEGGPLGLLGKARGLKALRGGRVPDALAEILIGLHNKGRRHRLPDWRAA